MTPETNHDVDISIYYDYLEDQGLIVDREEEEEKCNFDYDFLNNKVGGGSREAVGSFNDLGVGGGYDGLGGGDHCSGDVGAWFINSQRVGK